MANIRAVGIMFCKSKTYGPKICIFQLNILKILNQILHIVGTLETKEIAHTISHSHARAKFLNTHATDYIKCTYYPNMLKLGIHTLIYVYINAIQELFNCFIIAS